MSTADHDLSAETPEMNRLRARPWRGFSPETDVSRPKGMIGPEERACYYWLGRWWLGGRGVIVDAGAFLGASAFCFAAGAADAGRRRFGDGSLIHAYDYFSVVDDYVAAAIARDFRPIRIGESYLDIFRAQTAPYADMITSHVGDFLTQRWNGTPIEVLFVDIAKTEQLNAHVISEFFPALIPGRSVVIQQDYYHCWHPYIHETMEFFAEEFELIDEHVPHQSRVWRLARPLPPEKLSRVATGGLPAAERLALIDRLIARSSDHARPMLEVTRIWRLCLDGAWESAAAALAAFKEEWRPEGETALWAVQGRQVAEAIAARLEART